MALGTSDGTNFTAEERWFWFHPEDGWDADCVDTFSLTGTYAAFDYDNLGCSGCEEAYEYTRTLTDSTCGILYHQLFDLEDPPDDQIYYGIVLFDSFTPNGNPNEDNKMLVIGANRVASNSYSVDPNYARGQVFGESEEYYPPQAATYNWLGDLCVNIE